MSTQYFIVFLFHSGTKIALTFYQTLKMKTVGNLSFCKVCLFDCCAKSSARGWYKLLSFAHNNCKIFLIVMQKRHLKVRKSLFSNLSVERISTEGLLNGMMCPSHHTMPLLEMHLTICRQKQLYRSHHVNWIPNWTFRLNHLLSTFSYLTNQSG